MRAAAIVAAAAARRRCACRMRRSYAVRIKKSYSCYLSPRTCPKRPVRFRVVRLVVARCEVRYTGRLNAVLPESTRLLIFKSDGSVLVHADAGGYKPLNWNDAADRDRGGRGPDRGAQARGSNRGLPRDPGSSRCSATSRTRWVRRPGWRRTASSATCRRCSRPRPRRWGRSSARAARVGRRHRGAARPMCRDPDDGWVAVEIKRIAGIEAVEQLTRYLERIRVIRRGPSAAACSRRSGSGRRR